MSAFGFFFTPLAAAMNPADVTVNDTILKVDQELVESGADIFGGLAVMDELSMSEASGGSYTAIDIGDIGVNLATNKGSVSGTTTVNTNTGKVADNLIQGNKGITTVFNNTGNGVIMQSNVNVNVFLDQVGN